MDTNLGPRGQKRLLDPEYLSSSPWRLAAYLETMGSTGHPRADVSALQRVDDEMRVRAELMRESTPSSLRNDGDTEELPTQDESSNTPLFLKKVRFNDRVRQGSAPPRLEFGFDVNGSSSRHGLSASSYRDQSANGSRKDGVLIASDSGRGDDVGIQTSSDQSMTMENSTDTRMEGLLDDLETEVTCGLCAGVFVDVSFLFSSKVSFN